ncbi:MAG: hypothetical protein FMNOHCHN_00916 [Ignavibacteriaceae bacterium]|nr:hypothetical protein [Ignavibacteriaceae bacterium]
MFLLLLVLPFFAAAQIQNVTLLGRFHPQQGQGTDYNDCWGYVDSQGREYAIMGAQNGTYFVNITNPAQPVQVGYIPGPSSIWRDIKTHSHYAYITTEGTGTGQGLQIVDLSNLPTSVTLVNTLTTWFTRAHNIYIDNGYAYVIGTNNGGGMHILDLSNPANPVRTALYNTSGYIHDVYVWNDTVYAASEDTYDVVDVTNKSNPQRVSQSAALSGIYAHSGWMTEDKRYFIGAEEFNVRDITVWDLQDRTSWDLKVGQWQMPGNSPVHNIFVRGHFAHISYYKDGYVVLDVSNPLNPVKVGQYDTYSGTSGTYEGAWGAYPYFPSGNVIISDISTGLYIVDFTLDNVTPVELVSFSAVQQGASVQLEWATASEVNNRGFEIERSSDNQNWSAVGFVSGNGTITETSRYTFSDAYPAEGNAWYRLVQHDYDGAKAIHTPVEVFYDRNLAVSGFSLQQNYPNPFNPSTRITFSLTDAAQVTLKVYDLLGREIAVLVNGVVERGTHTQEFSASGLSSGIYIYELRSGNFVERRTMNLLK